MFPFVVLFSYFLFLGFSSTSVRKCEICEGSNVLMYEGGEYHLGHNYEWDCLDCGMSYYSRQLVYRLELDEVNRLRTTRSNLTPLTELRSLGVKDDNIWDLHLVEYNETLDNLMEDELVDGMVYCDEEDRHVKRINRHPTFEVRIGWKKEETDE